MKLMKRAIALLLCFLILTNGPISAFATEGVSDNDVVVETTTTTEIVEVCEECGESNAHTDTCSFNIAAPLTTETPDETTEPTTTPTEEPTTTPTAVTEPTVTTGPAISTDPVGCTECNQTEGHLESCSQYVAPTEETTKPTVSGNDVVACTECGATEGHLETCTQYVIPASVVCDLCGQSDGHMVGCFATFTEVEKTATFIEYPVTLYYNPVTEPDNCKSFDESEFGEKFTFTVQYSFPGADGVTWYVLDTENWEIFADTDAPYSYIQSDYVTFDLDTEDKTEQTLTDEGSGVRVSGYLPEGTSLSVEDASLDEVEGIDSSLAGIPEQYIGMNISLLRNGAEYQPAESVTVTMNVSSLASAGEDVLVYHVHENEDGTVTPEILGPFQVDENGNVTFVMSRFSYLLVFSGKAEYTISNVSVFYPVLEAPSGNGHYQFLGIYYDENNDLHFLLATCDKTPSEAESKFVSFYIDNKQYIVSTMGDNVQQVEVQTYSKVEFKDSDTGEVLDAVDITENKGIAKGFYDVNVGQQDVGQSFGFAVSQDSNMPSGSQAWNINGMVKVDLDYELIKTVAAGTSATGIFGESVIVDRGDWVIFKINVNNKGDRPLTDMLVKDILPEGVFDMSTVQMSIDGVGGAIGNWEPFNSTLFSNYDSEGHFSRLLYIKAQVDPDLSITTKTTYTNKATIDGMNMPTYEDTASVIVKAPTTGTLTVSKAVTSENPNDPAPDTIFTFTVHSDATNVGSFSYTKSDGTTGSVANDDTFTLKNGESIVFSDFPVGNFSITETKVAGYNTKINGAGANLDIQGNPAYSGSMTSLASPVVAFENQFATRMATLSISKKVEQEYPGDTPEIPADGFEFTVVFGDGTDTTTSYPYTKSDGTTGTITSGGTIKLGYDQTAVFSDIPVGTKYNITEILGELADDYVVSVNDNENVTSASGTMQVGSNVVTVVNTYTQHFTDLTITKTGAQTSLDENQSFIFDVVGPNGFKITVTINGNGSVTIKDVPFGQYTVTENTDWSWRYTPTDGASKTITLVANGENKVEFDNNRSWIYWLSGDSYNENQFTVKSKDDEE